MLGKLRRMSVVGACGAAAVVAAACGGSSSSSGGGGGGASIPSGLSVSSFDTSF